MKIKSGIIGTIPQVETLQKKPAAKGVAETAKPARQTDEAFSVKLSSKAEQLSKAPSPEEISRARVAAIRDQLASGTYNISGKDVANKILGVLKG